VPDHFAKQHTVADLEIDRYDFPSFVATPGPTAMLLTPWIQTNIDRVVVTRIDAEDKTAKARQLTRRDRIRLATAGTS
jgi:hypothetical protein